MTDDIHDFARRIDAPERSPAYLHAWCPGVIYVADLSDGIVKIGFTISLQERLDRLASRFNRRITLLGKIKSYRECERWLHQGMKKRRAWAHKSNETYHYDDVRDDVEEMLRTGEVPVRPGLLRMLNSGDISLFPDDVKIKGFVPPAARAA